MQATAPIAAAETLVTLPRAAALLLTPRMRCPFPDVVDSAYWDGSPWCVSTGPSFSFPSSRNPDSAVRRDMQPPAWRFCEHRVARHCTLVPWSHLVPSDSSVIGCWSGAVAP